MRDEHGKQARKAGDFNARWIYKPRNFFAMVMMHKARDFNARVVRQLKYFNVIEMRRYTARDFNARVMHKPGDFNARLVPQRKNFYVRVGHKLEDFDIKWLHNLRKFKKFKEDFCKRKKFNVEIKMRNVNALQGKPQSLRFKYKYEDNICLAKLTVLQFVNEYRAPKRKSVY